MRKLGLIMLFVLSLVLLLGCKGEEEPVDSTETELPSETQTQSETEETVIIDPTIDEIMGLENLTVSKNQYVDPMWNVKITSSEGEDVTPHLEVYGSIDYGSVGTYPITYQLDYRGMILNQERTITVVDEPIIPISNSRNMYQQPFETLGDGSYQMGSAPTIDHPINPSLIDQKLLNQAVPSNSWWTQLLVANYGGGNGIYTNPLRSAFQNDGAEITNPGTGFVQYWNPDGYNTMANFSLALPDMYLKSTSLNTGYQTKVIGYSDSTVTVSMRNTQEHDDHMVLTYAQGSPYIFAEVADSASPYLYFPANGVFGYEYYEVNGDPISGLNYQGSGIVVKLVTKHVGYQTSRPASVGQPIFDDRYFLISTPVATDFVLSSSNHPGNLLNKVSMDLHDQNYLSVAAIQSLDEAAFYHEHAYTKTIDSNISFEVNDEASSVKTSYLMTPQYLNQEKNDVLQFLMPHHQLYTDYELSNYEFETVRGHLRLMVGKVFETEMMFSGVVPALSLSNTSSLNVTNMTSYLTDLDLQNDLSDEETWINDDGPYWNSKALYPLAQGIIIADQIGNTALKSSMITKLKTLLVDWYQFSSLEDERYLYYNEAWGSVYYSNNDFNTASQLSDHAFTHGYFIYASSVLAMYDDTFVEDYGDMVSFLLDDYLYPYKNDYDFSYLRSFDPWAGHTWAHGFGTFAEGNNLESSSEAIQSWLAGYLWALQTNDQDLRNAAIYGFVHELNSAKMYMFDYEDVVFKDNYQAYAEVAGMIWGGKYDYATWFGANPTFIYGIQWLPNGEYISSYALNDVEKTRLTDIYDAYLDAKNGVIDTWFANMWSIQALLDPTLALNQFDHTKILNDDYPSDLSQTYYLLHGLNDFGSRNTEYHMVLNSSVSSSIYENENGEVYAIIWNTSHESQVVSFINPQQETITITVAPSSLDEYLLN